MNSTVNQTKARNRTVTLLAAVACAATQACMISPHDGQNIGTRDTPIEFANCTLNPNALIEIERCTDWYWRVPEGQHIYWERGEPVCRRTSVVTSYRTSSEPAFTDSLGIKWYCGTKHAVIPRSQWFLTGDLSKPYFVLLQAENVGFDPYGTVGTSYQHVYHNPVTNPDGSLACPAPAGYEQFRSGGRTCPNGTVIQIFAN